MRVFMVGVALLALAPPAAALQSESPVSGANDLSYADVADLAVEAPVVAHVRLKQAILLKGENAANVPPGTARYYVEADVLSLIRAPRSMSAELRYLVDLPLDASGRAPRLRKKTEYLLFGAPVPGRPGELRLLAPDAQMEWTPRRADLTRTILQEAAAADAAPRLVGIGRAFHVPGTLPGESETQLFLLAADGDPVSLTILRRPGQQPRWAVAMGEIIDESAEAPARDTLLWYRLACSLPQALPPRSLAESSPQESAAIREDYAFVLSELGPCARTRAPS